VEILAIISHFVTI